MAVLTDIVREENAPATLHALVQGIGGRVTRETLSESLLLHPEFPSLLSMSEVLSDFAIENAALQLNTVEQLRELPLPFVAHTRKHGGWYVLVTAIQSERIVYTDSVTGRTTEAPDTFARQWSGVVLLAEVNDKSGEAGYVGKRQQELVAKLRGPLVLATALLLLGVRFFTVAPTFKPVDWVLLMTKSAGLLLSYLLVRKQLGKSTALIDRFCRIHEKTSCDSVLTSAGAKIWGGISWSDAGLVYFAGGMLTLLTISGSHNVLAVLSLLVLPYVVYSVYYQWRVIRNWCTLCLSVQAILLVEASIALPEEYFLLTTDVATLVTSVTGFMVAASGWTLYRSYLISQTDVIRRYFELMRFKRNPAVFGKLLVDGYQIPDTAKVLEPIILGNREANHTITLVINPFCEPCRQKYKTLVNIIKKSNLTNIYLVWGIDQKSDHKIIENVKKLISLCINQDSLNVLDYWFDIDNFSREEWLIKHTIDDAQAERVESILQDHDDWCKEVNILRTPSIFIDGFEIPDSFSMSSLDKNLKYFFANNEEFGQI